MAGGGEIMAKRESRRRLSVALLLSATLIAVAHTPAAALCMPPMEVAGAAPEAAAINHRYVWFLIESLGHARLGWQEADGGADSQNPAVRLADLKLAVDDFRCAVTLVETFRAARGPDEYTTRAVQTSATAASAAYKAFATGFQQWVTALSRGQAGLPLEAAAEFKVQNEKAAEFLIHAASAAFFALLKPSPDSKTPMDRLTLTRADRAALMEGLTRHGFRAAPDQSPDTHSPDLAAAVLYHGLSSSQYTAFDEP
jgi:hypothetical protein